MYGVVGLLNANTGAPSKEEATSRAAVVSDVAELLNKAGSGYSTSAVAVNLLKQAVQRQRAPAAAASQALNLLSGAASSLQSSPNPLGDDLISSYVSGTVSAWKTVASDKTSAGVAVSNMLSVGSLLLTGSGADGSVTSLQASGATFSAARGSASFLQSGVKSLQVNGATMKLDSTFTPPTAAGCEYVDVSLGAATDAPKEGLVGTPVFVAQRPSVHCSSQVAAVGASQGSVQVVIPVSGIGADDTASCAAWNSGSGGFSSDGVTTVASSSSSVTCAVSGSRAVGATKAGPDDKGFPIGAIIGIAVGAAAIIAVIIVVVVVRRRRRKNREGFTEGKQYFRPTVPVHC